MPHRSTEDQVEDCSLFGQVCCHIQDVLVLKDQAIVIIWLAKWMLFISGEKIRLRHYEHLYTEYVENTVHVTELSFRNYVHCTMYSIWGLWHSQEKNNLCSADHQRSPVSLHLWLVGCLTVQLWLVDKYPQRVIGRPGCLTCVCDWSENTVHLWLAGTPPRRTKLCYRPVIFHFPFRLGQWLLLSLPPSPHPSGPYPFFRSQAHTVF